MQIFRDVLHFRSKIIALSKEKISYVSTGMF